MAAKAKVTKTAPVAEESTPAPAAATPKATKEAKEAAQRFTRVFDKGGKPSSALKEDGTPAKLAPQLQVIANTIEAAGKAGILRSDLITNLDGVLVTRQPVTRIVSYYQKDLVKYGLVTIV